MATKNSKAKASEKNEFGKYIRWFWGLFFFGIFIFASLFLLASWGAFGKMPEFEELENPELNVATEVFSADGETLGKYFKDNRTPVKYEDLPQNLIHALVSTEDVRYYNHSGIDPWGTLRAVVFLGTEGGASTITQQLAKLLFTDNYTSNKFERVFQKVKEWVIAVRLERQYTKKEIITMYLNKFDFVYNADGIRSASRIYFGKEPKDLKVEESAVLVAMLKNPVLFNPRMEQFKDNALSRRNIVLMQMEKSDFLTEKEKDSLQSLPIKLNFSPEQHDDGLATYFRAYLQSFLKNWIEENPKPNGEKYSLYRDGLKIYTSIDSRMQQYAEEAVAMHMANLQKEFNRQNEKNPTAPFRGIDKEQIQRIILRDIHNSSRWKKMKAEGKSEKEILASFDESREMQVFSWKGTIDTTMTPRDSIFYYKSFLNTGMMSMEPQTGLVRAWVGGINFRHFKYDHVKQGKRQVGSTFKPFVYATAIDQLHLSPCYQLPNTQFTIPAGRHGVSKDWTPSNAGNDYGGMMTLKTALAKSINVITARLMDKTGPELVLNLVEDLGVDTENMPAVAAIALGTVDISVFDMVAAYSTFANKGVYIEPVMITRIEDKNGTLLYQNTPISRDVLSEESAYVTINLMEGVTQAGSGVRLRTTGATSSAYQRGVVTGYPYDFQNPIAGKTGTTQNQSDGWFMGIVPNLVTGVWVGGENRAVHFPTIAYGQGATMALPIWAVYMKKLYANDSLHISKEEFERPEHLTIDINCSDNDEPAEQEEPDATGQLDF
ncbi:MAG TPA: transglycosylase domain-containing protein [Flavobacteriaceae bacterium]|nr:transglycosylase domain-containing protein [Flavobacteriaceae bacterium]